jgi:hypothetical protein
VHAEIQVNTKTTEYPENFYVIQSEAVLPLLIGAEKAKFVDDVITSITVTIVY